MTIFVSFSGLSEPSVVGDYKKSVSRASRASMSLETLIHDANYGEQWPEMVEASSRYDPPKSILIPPEKTKKSPFGVIFWTVGTVICGRLQKARKSS